MTPFRQVKALRPCDLWLMLHIACMLCVLPLLQRLLTLPTLLKLVDARPRSTSPSPSALDRLMYLTRGLLHQHIGMFRPNCVKQSLVLFHFLRKWGHPVRVHFGVIKDGADLAGHCWLELDDAPLAEPADPRLTFTTVYTYPEAAFPSRRTMV